MFLAPQHAPPTAGPQQFLASLKKRSSQKTRLACRGCRGLLRGLWFLVQRPGRALGVLLLLALILAALLVPAGYLAAWYHYRQAEQALAQRQFAAALEHLDFCLRLWPQSGPTHLLAARCARRGGDLERAARHLAAAQKAWGRIPAPLKLERALLTAQKGEVDDVKRYLFTLVEQNHPETPLILEALALGYLRGYRLDEAFYCLERWQQQQPQDAQVYFLRGWVREFQEDSVFAAPEYRKALELDPKRDDARQRLASILTDNNQPLEAIGHLEVLVQKHPQDVPILVDLARCRYLLGQTEEAEALLERALKLKPFYTPALVARGQLALELGQAAAAVSWLERVVQQVPGHYAAHFSLYRAYTRLGRKEAAAREQRLMDKCQQDIRRIHHIIREEIGAAPHDPQLHYEVGRILLQGGYSAEGLRWLRSALKWDPQHRPTHQLLADYYDRLGVVGLADHHRLLASSPAQAAGGPPHF
jgi:tetratricopeptide (TPR) repeat protein